MYISVSLYACLQPVNASPSSETHISVTYLVIGSFPFCKGNSPIVVTNDVIIRHKRHAVLL